MDNLGLERGKENALDVRTSQGKGTARQGGGISSTRMTHTPTDDLPGFVAEESEHCHECYRLIRPGQRYFLTIEQAAVCPDGIGAADAVRLAGGLTIEVWEDRLQLRRGSMALVAFPHQVRHRVDALLEAVGRLNGVDRVSRTMDASEGVSFESLNR